MGQFNFNFCPYKGRTSVEILSAFKTKYKYINGVEI